MREEDAAWQKEWQRDYDRSRISDHRRAQKRATYHRNKNKEDNILNRIGYYYSLDTGKKREYDHQYYIKHQDKIKTRSNEWSKNNKEKLATAAKRRYEIKKQEIKEKVREWCRLNPDKRKQIIRNYSRKHLLCRTCNLFGVSRRGQECATCGGYRVNSAEYEIRDYIKQFYPQALFDKQMPGSCVKYRPDVLIETLWGIVILEVDEDMHLREQASCEVIREYNIWQSLGCDVTFIRLNVDAYKPDGETTQRLSKEERLGAMFLAIQEAHETHRSGLNIEYLYYSPQRIAELDAERAKLPK